MPKPLRTDRVPLYLGIDPGVGGGIVALSNEPWEAVPLARMTPKDTFEWLGQYSWATFACIEYIQSGTFGGKKGGSIMKLYGSYKLLEGFLIALDIPYYSPKSKEWQKGVGMSPRKKTESNTQWKNRLKFRAQQLFPKEHITLATSDAYLIAEFCRLSRERTVTRS